MRILAVDYGTARIGLAQSDPTGFLAQGLSVLKRTSDAAAVAEIGRLAKQNEVDKIVVGLPKNMNGSIGPRAEQCTVFATQLQESTGLPVDLFDERLTTVAAERLLIGNDMRRQARKQVIDAVAATLLLQSYLDREQHRRRQTGSDEPPTSDL